MFLEKEQFKQEYRDEVIELMGKPLESCGPVEKYEALVRLLGNYASKAEQETTIRYGKDSKQVYYFSLEFLIGRLLNNYLINFGVRDVVEEGLKDLGIDLQQMIDCELDPALGNGGLGRLAACFLDSMAFLGVPGTGMGIRYRYGLFKQKIVDGCQVEEPDAWLANGFPWEVKKRDEAVVVKFGGVVDRTYENGQMLYHHRGYEEVLAVPYDVPVVGYTGRNVNTLRLWWAQPVKDTFDLDAFNKGDYSGAVKDRSQIEAISSVLYPDDSSLEGRELRLKQEYFFVAAGITSILRQYKEKFGTNDWARFPERVSIHINDTHPTLCIPVLVRMLLDDEGLPWDEAWKITTGAVTYTNHTVLPEALEKWDIPLFSTLLPREYMIVEEIDRRYKEEFDKSRDNWQRLLEKTSILWDGQVHMANMSVIGSRAVNGVAGIHTEILKKDTLNEFYILTPEKFNNKTNGVSHRRFLVESNPGLTKVLTDTMGSDRWILNPTELRVLKDRKNDEELIRRLKEVKTENKKRLADYIWKNNGIEVPTDFVFDIHVKRIHAYKRQLLGIYKIMYLYNELKANPDYPMRPHAFIFAGKAARSYVFAKEVIRLINAVADMVNNDPQVNSRMRVVFIENFNVSNAQIIYPAADISEQISTAGKEASGTGNMKFMFNGAITLGTLDGANVEIHDIVGDDNICIFGLKADEAMSISANRSYNSFEEAQSNPALKRICSQFVDGSIPSSKGPFWNVYDNIITYNDEFLVMKDFESYVNAWHYVSDWYGDEKRWYGSSLVNIAGAGYFTSDRTISQYANDIWGTGCDNYNY